MCIHLSASVRPTRSSGKHVWTKAKFDSWASFAANDVLPEPASPWMKTQALPCTQKKRLEGEAQMYDELTDALGLPNCSFSYFEVFDGRLVHGVASRHQLLADLRRYTGILEINSSFSHFFQSPPLQELVHKCSYLLFRPFSIL
jgi:hypothetical protein